MGCAMRRAARLVLLALLPVAQCGISFPARPRVAAPAPAPTKERERGAIRLGAPKRELGRLRQLLAGLLADRRKRRVLVAVAVFNWLQTQARLQIGKRRALRAFSKLERPEITIVTTAAMPWMTGTAVNALLRAAYLAEEGYRVTLCVPWIHPDEQALVLPKGKLCATPDAQEQLMRTWLSERDGAVAPFEIRFYPARFDVMRGSILPLGDTTRWVGSSCDLCVLEEPEHLNWCRSTLKLPSRAAAHAACRSPCGHPTLQKPARLRSCCPPGPRGGLTPLGGRRGLRRRSRVVPAQRRRCHCVWPNIQVPRRRAVAEALQASRRRGAHPPRDA